MNVKKIKKSIKMTVGFVGLIGSLANVCLANILCFQQEYYLTGSMWFVFGLCASFACIEYIIGKEDINV